MNLGIGCVRRIMRLIGNSGKKNLIVASGRRDGKMGGGMEGVTDFLLVFLHTSRIGSDVVRQT